MKKITISIISGILLAICVLSASVAASDEKSIISDEAVNVIKLLEIANGDQNGNMNYSNNVTRAEFVKMIVNASTDKDLASNTKLNVSLFPDVRNNHWAASYVSIAIDRGLVNGYLDGTFKPSNNVTLEEAATIVLRLLGYTGNDFLGNYPTAQLNKYRDLDLDVNITANQGEKMTREQCMILIYNMLSTKTKNGAVYCTTLGYAVDTENRFDYSALLKSKLDGPYVANVNSQSIEAFIPNDSTFYMLNNTPCTSKDIKSGDILYTNNVINTVYAYRKTATGVVSNSTDSTVSVGNKTYTISTTKAKQKLALGGKFSQEKAFITLVLGIDDTVVDVYDGDINLISSNDDNATYLEMINATISSPIFIESETMLTNWVDSIPFVLENAEIYLNGTLNSEYTAQKYDIIYYSAPFSSIWVYRKTASGTIEQISTPASPNQITLSGKTYSVVTSQASYELSVYGKYSVGDKVTLALGINDECVAILDAAVTPGSSYGVITDMGEKTYTDKNNNTYTGKYITVTDTTNTPRTFEYQNNKLNIGDPVKVTVSDKIVITKIPANTSRNTAALISKALKNGLFTDDCEIIEYYNGNTAKIPVSRISGTVIEPDLIIHSYYFLYVEFDSDNYIKRMILDDYTGDFDEYGIIVSKDTNTITYMVNGEKRTYSASDSNIGNVPIRIYKTETGTTNIRPLINKVQNIVLFNGVVAYDENGNSYNMADNVSYYINNGGLYSSNLEDMLSSDYNFTAYFDKDYQYGGQIRIIIATRKV